MRFYIYFIILYFYSITNIGQDKLSVEFAVKNLSVEGYETRAKAKKLLKINKMGTVNRDGLFELESTRRNI